MEMLKSMTGSGGVDKKIDNISTFLLRMNNKIDSLAKWVPVIDNNHQQLIIDFTLSGYAKIFNIVIM